MGQLNSLPVPNAQLEGIQSQWRYFIFIFITAAIFLIQHNPLISLQLMAGQENEINPLIEAVKGGTLTRQVGLSMLLLISIVFLISGKQNMIQTKGVLSCLILFYLFWASLSVLWADDMFLSLKRVIVLWILCFSAFAVARRFSVYEIISLTLFITGSFLVIGVGMEIFLGTFHPYAAGYRFAGTLHPNHQGDNCAILLLTVIASTRNHDRGKNYLLYTVSVIVLIFLVLTKSRTAVVSFIFGFLAFWFMVSSRNRKIGWILVVSWVSLILLLLFSDDFLKMLQHGILLGRADEESVYSLTGRIPLWEECLEYFWQRPLTGYGYNAFWTPQKIMEFSRSQGWGIIETHSAYLELLLCVGIVGLSLFLLIFFIGIKRLIVSYRTSFSTDYALLCSILVFSLANGFLESTIVNPEWPTLLNLTIFAYAGFLRLKDENS
jgi:exopolysaccharide production protein ExoQ